jgi:protein phosphatase
MEAFRDAIIALNNQVHKKASSVPDMNGMGATIVSSLIREDNTYIASVGDSPAYIHTEGRLLKLTIEHTVGTLLKNNQSHKYSVPLPALLKNLLVQYIGMEVNPAPDIIRVDFKPGERLLLCSDGLTSCLREDVIGDFLPQGSPTESCRRLVDLAMTAGGVDNITVIVIDRLPRR